MELIRRLRIDLGELCVALEDNSYEHEYYLDLETGEILMLSEYMDTEEAQGLRDQLEEEPGRYEAVPKMDSREAYRDMEEFIRSVEDSHLQELLGVAIDGRGAFRRFKDVLARFPEEREEWFRFIPNNALGRTRGRFPPSGERSPHGRPGTEGVSQGFRASFHLDPW